MNIAPYDQDLQLRSSLFDRTENRLVEQPVKPEGHS